MHDLTLNSNYQNKKIDLTSVSKLLISVSSILMAFQLFFHVLDNVISKNSTTQIIVVESEKIPDNFSTEEQIYNNTVHLVTPVQEIITPAATASQIVEQVVEKNEPVQEKIVSTPKTEILKLKNNIVVILMGKGSTLYDALIQGNFDKKNAHLIAFSISKKYNLSKIREGDKITISPQKIIIKDKIIFLLNKKGNSKYEVTLENKNLIIPVAKKTVALNSISKIKQRLAPTIRTLEVSSNTAKATLDGANLIASGKSSKVPSIIVKDVMNINSIVKAKRLEVAYDKKSGKFLSMSVAGNTIYKYNNGKNTYYVMQNGTILNNNNLHTTTAAFRPPVQRQVIGSGFGMRFHPILKKKRMHSGVDFRGAKGAPVYAAADGKVIQAHRDRGFGNCVKIRHGNNYTTLYAHLDRFASNTGVGRTVKAGELIGFIGKTGMATGEHLHFELHHGGRPINPMHLINVKNSKKNTGNRLIGKQLYAFNIHKAKVNAMVNENRIFTASN